MVEQEVSRLHVQLMEAMMRLDEQSAILDASMRLGMMHVPSEPEPEPERRPEQLARPGANSRTEENSADEHRNGDASDRAKGLGPGITDRSLEISQSPSLSKEKGQRRNNQNAAGADASVAKVDTSEPERRSDGASSSDSAGRRSGREALGVPQGRKWGGELLEVAEEENMWSQEEGKPEDDHDAAERRDGEGLSYGRFRVASLTPIPENDSRQLTPEGDPERKESATWHDEEADSWNVGRSATWQGETAEETAEASATDRDEGRILAGEKEWPLLEQGENLQTTEGNFGFQTWKREAVTAKHGTEQATRSIQNGADGTGTGTEEAASDPIIAMIRRLSQSSAVELPEQGYGDLQQKVDGDFETDQTEMEPETERHRAEAEDDGGQEESVATGVLTFDGTGELVASSRGESGVAVAGGTILELLTDESRESAEQLVDGSEVSSRIAWESYDQEWVEKKVVGSSAPGSSQDTRSQSNASGSGAHAGFASEARPAAYSMHSHVIPDYVVDWPESPGVVGAATFSPLQSPVSPPPFALPDMA